MFDELVLDIKPESPEALKALSSYVFSVISAFSAVKYPTSTDNRTR